jgi:hypothetical protein
VIAGAGRSALGRKRTSEPGRKPDAGVSGLTRSGLDHGVAAQSDRAMKFNCGSLVSLVLLAAVFSCGPAWGGDLKETILPMADTGQRPPWDDAQAAKLVGAKVLIGITRLGPKGPHNEQMFGVISSASSKDGFEVRLSGTRAGETYWLPPDLRNFAPAKPGNYRLRNTGEVVVDPDYTSSWTVDPPAP